LAEVPVRTPPTTAGEPSPSTDAIAPAGDHQEGDDRLALAEAVDLDPDVKGRVIEVFRDLDRLDHYALLGVGRDADRKAIKRAYFELAAKFHPDKYFRKRLGPFKPKMEAIFARVTLAHDALADKARRTEYDAYLHELQKARGIEDLLADAMTEVRRAAEKVEREVRASEATGAASSPPPPSQPAPEVALAARREALARRLLGGRSPSSPSIHPPSPSGGNHVVVQSSTADAVLALKQRYEERVRQAKNAQARKYVSQAMEATAKGDHVAAANAMRVAVGLSPDDAEVQQLASAAQARADSILSETYTNQAQYEEKNERWVEAARSWGRARRGRPNDAHVHERAAHAIIKAGGDLHEAERLAQRSCELAPSLAAPRVTLAEVYLAAGLPLKARRVLETAAQAAPHDASIQAMLEKLFKPG